MEKDSKDMREYMEKGADVLMMAVTKVTMVVAATVE